MPDATFCGPPSVLKQRAPTPDQLSRESPCPNSGLGQNKHALGACGEDEPMPARHLRTNSTTLRLTIALLVSAAVTGRRPGGPVGRLRAGSRTGPDREPHRRATDRATDPHRRPRRGRTPTRARPYSGYLPANPVRQPLTGDTYTWGTTPPNQDRPTAKGTINWRVNPDNNPSCVQFGALTSLAGARNQRRSQATRRALQRVSADRHDWVNDKPVLVEVRRRAYESTMHRNQRDPPLPNSARLSSAVVPSRRSRSSAEHA